MRVRSAAPRVLMVGTAVGGKGGIASAVAVLRGAGLFEREGVQFIATHVDGAWPVKLACAVRGLWQAAAVCLRRRPAIVHVHVASGASFVRKSLVLALARAAGAQTVFHLHGGAFDRYATEHAGPLLRRWIRHTLEASACVIALSPAWAAFLQRFAPRARVEVVPNAVAPAWPVLASGAGSGAAFGPASGPAAEAASTAGSTAGSKPGSLAGPPEAQRILFLGRVHRPKGVGELIAACARLAPRFPALRLVLAGEGEIGWARTYAEALGIGAQLELPGWLDSEARAEQLARASLFCLPSWAEGVPMAMLEAMAAGCPVVLSAVGGMRDVIRDGVDGVLVPPRDVDALAAGIERVLVDTALAARLAQAARLRIAQEYSADGVCCRLAAIYARLTDESDKAQRDTAQKDTEQKDREQKDREQKDTAQKDTAQKDTAQSDAAEMAAAEANAAEGHHRMRNAR